jgi:hypothetical protein
MTYRELQKWLDTVSEQDLDMEIKLITRTRTLEAVRPITSGSDVYEKDHPYITIVT